MSLDLQVSQEHFEKLKTVADYASEITRVVSLSDQGILEANRLFPGILNQYKEVKEIEKQKPAIAKYQKGKIFIENGNADLLLFLGIFSGIRPQVKTGGFDRFFIAVREGFIKIDDSLEKVLTPMDWKSTIGELISSIGKIRFRGKLWSLKELGPENNIQKTLLFHQARRIKTTFMSINNAVIQEHNAETGITKIFDSNKNLVYNVKFYSRAPLLKQILKPGRILNIMTNKIYGNETIGYTINAPWILPKGMNIKNIYNLKSPRSIPTSFYNAAWYEYEYRRNKGEKK